ncbi:hypothetical protein [Cupriavidus basilensis]|uniref:hypothetical protein n=1 Tax=Cupriavidus basilensis TaxID=68895 RepID=UPI000AE311C0|nr:hypothetical protein [Cupriavidus basilensis]
MANLYDLATYRKAQKRPEQAPPQADTILIRRIANGDYAYFLNGIFRTSRRLTAQVITSVLGEVLED